MKKYIYIYVHISFFLYINSLFAQCANQSNVFSFIYNDKSYEIVKENKNWTDAVTCAIERGGFLVEINSQEENQAILSNIVLAGVNFANTIASDGGGGAFMWIGGNDFQQEASWVWNGDNNASSILFWTGDYISGQPENGLYNNWGDEPDDFNNNQDALAFSLNGWMFGIPGQWNDLNHTNTLYYIVEFSNNLSLIDNTYMNKVNVFPNPVTNSLHIDTKESIINYVEIINMIGQQVYLIKNSEKTAEVEIDLSNMEKGVYFVKIYFNNGKSVEKKFIKI